MTAAPEARSRSAARKVALLTPLAALSLAGTIAIIGFGGQGASSAQAPTAEPTLTRKVDLQSAATVGDPLAEQEAQQPSAAPASPSSTPGPLDVTTYLGGGIPAPALAAYQSAAANVDATSSCGLPWTLLAGIGRVESNHGRGTYTAQGVVTPSIYGPLLDGSGQWGAIRDTDGGKWDGNAQFDRAVGPMQFIPSTWAKYQVDADGDGVANPQDINDAALAAAQYLCASGDDLSTAAGMRTAVLRYNHDDHYADVVLAIQAAYAAGDWTATPGSLGVADAGIQQLTFGPTPVPSASLAPAAPSRLAEPQAIAYCLGLPSGASVLSSVPNAASLTRQGIEGALATANQFDVASDFDTCLDTVEN